MNKLRLMLSVITLNQSRSLRFVRLMRIKLNQAYRIENFLLVADFEYALEEHDELAE